MRFLILIISSLLLLFTNFGVTSFSPDTNVLDNQCLSEKTTLNKKYKKALENEQPYILPNEYGYWDAYTYSTTYCDNFITHACHNNDFNFETRRYRVGYIHNEFVVLSPTRIGFNEAYIEYRFKTPIDRMDIEMSHWREYAHEWLDASHGTAKIEYLVGDTYYEHTDLLSSTINLSHDRTQLNLINVTFIRPTYRVRIRATINFVAVNESNRGRICIGKTTFYPNYSAQRLSGYELDYLPTNWNSPTVVNNVNCYGYALNNQTNPHNNYDIWPLQQPGEFSSGNHYFSPDNCTFSYIKSCIEADFSAYNLEYNLNLICISEVDRFSAVPLGSYKICLAIDPGVEYHFYRQNSDGYWSHKYGNLNVSNVDQNNNIITDPYLCALPQNICFVRYYAISPWGNFYA